jgi:hypothetical protein
MYSPCPPWEGRYGPWVPPLMHFHPGWSGPVEGFSHGGYFTRDGHYGYVGHQYDSKTLSQENRMVRNLKPDGPVSLKTTTAPGHWQEQEAPEDGASVDQPGSSQGQIGPGSKTSVNDEAKRWQQSRIGFQR